MYQSHQTSYRRLRHLVWVYDQINGSDIGWRLARSPDIPGDCPNIQVVGSEGAYQVLDDGTPIVGLYDKLETAKKAAESHLMQQKVD